MPLTVKYIVSNGRRRSSTAFVTDKDVWLDAQPGYVRQSVETMTIWKLKIRR